MRKLFILMTIIIMIVVSPIMGMTGMNLSGTDKDIFDNPRMQNFINVDIVGIGPTTEQKNFLDIGNDGVPLGNCSPKILKVGNIQRFNNS